jgi:hypothetical protein
MSAVGGKAEALAYLSELLLLEQLYPFSWIAQSDSI